MKRKAEEMEALRSRESHLRLEIQGQKTLAEECEIEREKLERFVNTR